jgi:RNA polymerase sigma factor (sigma-70 family)
VLSSEQLRLLWQRHAAALLLVARGHCSGFGATAAEDCVQKAFVRLATQEPQPHEPAGWLMRTVRNAAIDVVRSQQRRRSREEKAVENRPAWLEPIDPSTFDSPSAQELTVSLEKLDAVTRDIIIGHVWNNLTFRQIADAMDLSPATAHRRYDAGLKHLKHLLSSDPETAATHIQTIPDESI